MTCIVYTYTQDHFQVSWLTAHAPRPGALDSWLTAHGPRLGARLRPWLYATNFLPIAQRARAKHFHFGLVANPTAHGSGVRAPARVRWPTARGSVRGSGLGSRPRISFPLVIVLGPSTLVLGA